MKIRDVFQDDLDLIEKKIIVTRALIIDDY